MVMIMISWYRIMSHDLVVRVMISVIIFMAQWGGSSSPTDWKAKLALALFGLLTYLLYPLFYQFD